MLREGSKPAHPLSLGPWDLMGGSAGGLLTVDGRGGKDWPEVSQGAGSPESLAGTGLAFGRTPAPAALVVVAKPHFEVRRRIGSACLSGQR